MTDMEKELLRLLQTADQSQAAVAECHAALDRANKELQSSILTHRDMRKLIEVQNKLLHERMLHIKVLEETVGVLKNTIKTQEESIDVLTRALEKKNP